MKIGTITTTNTKGQIVIPKEMRRALGIDGGSTLQLTLAGAGIYLSVVEAVVTSGEAENSYLELLKKTQGAWADEPQDVTGQTVKSRQELAASKARKTAW